MPAAKLATPGGSWAAIAAKNSQVCDRTQQDSHRDGHEENRTITQERCTRDKLPAPWIWNWGLISPSSGEPGHGKKQVDKHHREAQSLNNDRQALQRALKSCCVQLGQANRHNVALHRAEAAD